MSRPCFFQGGARHHGGSSLDTSGISPAPEDFPQDASGVPSQDVDEAVQSPEQVEASAQPSASTPEEPIGASVDAPPADEPLADASTSIQGTINGESEEESVGPTEPYHPP